MYERNKHFILLVLGLAVTISVCYLRTSTSLFADSQETLFRGIASEPVVTGNISDMHDPIDSRFNETVSFYQRYLQEEQRRSSYISTLTNLYLSTQASMGQRDMFWGVYMQRLSESALVLQRLIVTRDITRNRISWYQTRETELREQLASAPSAEAAELERRIAYVQRRQRIERAKLVSLDDMSQQAFGHTQSIQLSMISPLWASASSLTPLLTGNASGRRDGNEVMVFGDPVLLGLDDNVVDDQRDTEVTYAADPAAGVLNAEFQEEVPEVLVEEDPEGVLNLNAQPADPLNAVNAGDVVEVAI